MEGLVLWLLVFLLKKYLGTETYLSLLLCKALFLQLGNAGISNNATPRGGNRL